MSRNVNPFLQIRTPDSTLAGLRDALNELQPTDAQWWEYSVSHCRFILRLYNSGEPDDLMIGTFWAGSISGPTHWLAPSLDVEFSAVAGSSAEEIQWIVRDEKNSFVLSCGNLFWGRNVGRNTESDWCRKDLDHHGDTTSSILGSSGSYIEFRNYCSADRVHVVTLWDQVFPDSTEHNDPNASIDRKVAADDGLFFVAADGDAIVGTVLAGYDGHRGWLYSVAVAPYGRRDGIGSQLIRHAEQALAQRGCPKLNIQVRADNAAVMAFYESLGFQTEERISMGKLITE